MPETCPFHVPRRTTKNIVFLVLFWFAPVKKNVFLLRRALHEFAAFSAPSSKWPIMKNRRFVWKVLQKQCLRAFASGSTFFTTFCKSVIFETIFLAKFEPQVE